MKKLSILIYSMGSGGAERVVSMLLPKLIKHYEVKLVLLNEIIHYEIPKEVETIILDSGKIDENPIVKLLKLPTLAFKYMQFVNQNRIDISLSFMTRPNYVNIISKLFGNQSKIIISERAMPSLEYAGQDLKSKINRLLIKTLYPYAEKIITNSDGNTKDLIENFTIEKAKITRIYNPLDLDSINKKRMEKIDFDFSKKTFITIGRLDNGKNHKMIIDAFHLLDDKESQLIIIGYGELERKLREYIDYLDLNDRVFLVGKQSNPYGWLNHASCFVFASKHEGFPNVILEALACNLPVISTNPNGVVGEILKNDRYGVVVENEKEMAEAMKDYVKKEDLQTRAEDFTLEKIFPQFLEAIVN